MTTATPEYDLRRARLFDRRTTSELTSVTRGRVAALAGDVIRLPAGGLWSAAKVRTPLRLRCDAGTVWITQAGHPGDTVLSAGESFATKGGGKLVVQALTDATVSTRHESAE